MKYQVVYSIKSKINKKVYIGKTNDLKNRISSHKTTLEKGCHYNHYLQRHYNKYTNGCFYDVFEISLIEQNILSENISEREIYWIDHFNSTNRLKGFNMTIGGEIPQWSQEVLKRRINTFIKNNLTPIYMYDTNGIFIGEFKVISEIAKKFNLNKNAVANAYGRGIRYKDYLFYREKKVFDKYIPNASYKTIYIKVCKTDGEIIEVIKGLSECAKKYNMNVNTLNSRCRRKTVIDDIYFEKVEKNDLSQFVLWLDMFKSFGTDQITLLHIDEKMGEKAA